ncbi:MAG: cation transporter, partial [Clostridia bacterium]|nr:cation transporter [Clostridia bacterium]
MTSLLIKLFVKNADETEHSEVRGAYGKLASLVGIIANLLLCITKAIAGTLSGSISITADAVNNLSDASASIISLLGFKLASKPADEDHPYGHARYEYLSGLLVAVIILIIGFDLFKESVGKIISPTPVAFNALTVAILVVSIIVKLWLAVFNRTIGKKICSSTLIATSADSRNDVITTSAILVSMVISHLIHFELDGYVGVAVAIFILYSGVNLIHETLDPILGRAPDKELVSKIKEKIESYEGILGTHDLMVHDYGPGNQFASVHAEVSAEEDAIVMHDVIDNIEREVAREFGIHLVIHMDPIITTDERVNEIRIALAEKIKEIEPSLT